jgi:hypothetical protein
MSEMVWIECQQGFGLSDTIHHAGDTWPINPATQRAYIPRDAANFFVSDGRSGIRILEEKPRCPVCGADHQPN